MCLLLNKPYQMTLSVYRVIISSKVYIEISTIVKCISDFRDNVRLESNLYNSSHFEEAVYIIYHWLICFAFEMGLGLSIFEKPLYSEGLFCWMEYKMNGQVKYVA